MIGGLFIYNHKGEVLISRVYRDDIGYVSGERTFLNFRGDVLLGRGGRSGIDRGIISLGRLRWLHLTSFAIICLCVGKSPARITCRTMLYTLKLLSHVHTIDDVP